PAYVPPFYTLHSYSCTIPTGISASPPVCVCDLSGDKRVWEWGDLQEKLARRLSSLKRKAKAKPKVAKVKVRVTLKSNRIRGWMRGLPCVWCRGGPPGRSQGDEKEEEDDEGEGGTITLSGNGKEATASPETNRGALEMDEELAELDDFIASLVSEAPKAGTLGAKASGVSSTTLSSRSSTNMGMSQEVLSISDPTTPRSPSLGKRPRGRPPKNKQATKSLPDTPPVTPAIPSNHGRLDIPSSKRSRLVIDDDLTFDDPTPRKRGKAVAKDKVDFMSIWDKIL
ncbi:hypothetical protein EV426DRAFT_686711, partial [Tirmania nivea]